MSAGYTPGAATGVPALHIGDASMGVTNPGDLNREGDTVTAMPACIARGASFNPELARAPGAAIGRETRSRGFNVQLAGGINLMRNPRNGRSVVLETGNPFSAPWRDKVKAIMQAWDPGQAGGQAIAEVLTRKVNPSGHLPITWPESLDPTPRPELPGMGTPWGTPTTIEHSEGAVVGYRWFAKIGARPIYPYGHGLSYTTFEYTELAVEGGDTITASFTVTNTGDRAGADVPQLYLTEAAGDKRMRLLGFERVELQPGAVEGGAVR